MKRRTVWTVAGGVVAAVAVGIGIWGWQLQSAAESGRTELTDGLHSLQAGDPISARDSFAQAQADFDRSQALTGPKWLQSIPLAGRQLQAVDQLAEIGSEGSSAAIQMAELMSVANTTSSDGSVNEIIKSAKPYLLSILQSFNHIAVVAPELSTDGLLPPVANAVTTMKDALDPFQPIFAQADSLTTLVNYLLSEDHRFLLVSQNNAELRATGGFMGSMGWVNIGPSGLKLEKYQNIYSLPWNTTNVKRPPGARMGSWPDLKFWDANWWLDFPTTNHTLLDIYGQLKPKQRNIDGIIFIDLVTVKSMLAQFGPIDLPNFNKTITADNMLPILQRLITQDFGGQSIDTRKDILVDLSSILLSRMMHVTPAQLVPTVATLGEMANQKHVQFYVRDAAAQASLSNLALGASITPPDGMTDEVAMVNTISWPSKLNFGMHKSVDYTVNLNDNGTANTTLGITYVKDKERLLTDKRAWFGDYLRVYRPAGTTLDGANSKRTKKPVLPAQKKAEVAPKMGAGELGSSAIIQSFSVLLGETRTLTFKNTVPGAVASGPAPTLPAQPKTTTSSNAEVYHYRLFIPRQADLEDNAMAVTVNAPSGWTITGANTWERYSGASVSTTTSSTTATMSTPLSADLIMDVTLTKG